MRILSKRVLVLGALTVAALASIPGLAWLSLTHEPRFYREMVKRPRANREKEARRFVAQSLQLRNDFVNEPRWEAVFTDEQVNSWLAEDLVSHFSDQIPAGVSEPRILFELDRVHFGFQLEQGPIKSVVSVVGRVRVMGEHELAITIEHIRAGVLPIPTNQLLERIADTARAHGLDIRWEVDGDSPMAIVKYTPEPRRRDIILDKLQILDGQIRLAGRSSKGQSVASPSLPSRKVLQSTFPGAKKKDQEPAPSRDNMISPFS